MAKLLINNDQTVQLSGLRNAVTGAYINDATVTMELRDSSDLLVADSDVAMAYITGSNGDYSGQLQDTLVLTEGSDYDLIVTAVGGGLNYQSRDTFRAQRRSGFNLC